MVEEVGRGGGEWKERMLRRCAGEPEYGEQQPEADLDEADRMPSQRANSDTWETGRHVYYVIHYESVKSTAAEYAAFPQMQQSSGPQTSPSAP
jgi:hypothetical protein